MENNKQSIYGKGIYFNKLKPETPDSVKKWKKGGISVHAENFTNQLKELAGYVNERGYVNFDLVENEKDGEKFLSFKLNTWKPEDTKQELEKKEEDVIRAEDIPFN